MDFVKFSSATCKVFPIANSKTGGQFLTEENLRSRESVGTDPSINYISYPSYTHNSSDFQISIGNNNHTIVIAPGQCVLNGHYFRSEAPIEIDLLVANGSVDNTADTLKGSLKIGLRAYYSTDATISGSLVPEDTNYMLEGIRVVILPANQFVTPIDTPDDEDAITAHLLLGSFKYSDRITNVSQNANKIYSIPASRISDLGTAMDGRYLTANAVYPSGIFTLEGRGSKDGTISMEPTWTNSTDSLMVWDTNTEITFDRPELQSAQFDTESRGAQTFTVLQMPHKQIEGYFIETGSGSGATYRRAYFLPKQIALPLADFDRGTAGTVDRNYTQKVKDVLSEIDKLKMLPAGKQRAFIEEIASYNDRFTTLPAINNSWNAGDYVLVRNDMSLPFATDGDMTTSTMYVVLGPQVSNVVYADEVYQTGTITDYTNELNSKISTLGLTGADINSAGMSESESLGVAATEFAKMYYESSINELVGRKSGSKYSVYKSGTTFAFNSVAAFPVSMIVGAQSGNKDAQYRIVRLGTTGVGSISNAATPLEVIAGESYTLSHDASGTMTTMAPVTATAEMAEANQLIFGTGTNKVVVSGGSTITFDFSARGISSRDVNVSMFVGSGITNYSEIYLVSQDTANYYDVYIYSGSANLGTNGYVKKCTGIYCEGLTASNVNNKITPVIDTYITDVYNAALKLTNTDGSYIYRISNTAATDYMTFTYELRSNTSGQSKLLTEIFTIPNDGTVGGKGYSEPIILTGPNFLATVDTIGGFYNIDNTSVDYTDNGYIYLDSEGHLRLLDYELLRSAELAYILNTDKSIGTGLTYEEIQSQLDNEVNNRVAFPMEYTENTELHQYVINLTLTLPKSETAQTITIDNIDERYGTAVILTIKGDADENTTIDIINCTKLRVNPNISGNPNINISNCSVYYDASVFDIANFENITLWYERYSDADPNLVVNGMTVTDLDVASFILGQDTSSTAYLNQEDRETVQYTLTFGDYNFTYGLRSLTLSNQGEVVGAGIYVKNQSSTQSTISVSSDSENSSMIYLAKFRLPQSVNLQYPINKITANIRVDGSFISGYETTDNNKYILATNSFAAMVNKYNPTELTTFEEYGGILYAIGTISYRIDSDIYTTADVSVASDIILSAGISGAMDAVLQSFDNNAYHIFEGYSIPVIGQG